MTPRVVVLAGARLAPPAGLPLGVRAELLHRLALAFARHCFTVRAIRAAARRTP